MSETNKSNPPVDTGAQTLAFLLLRGWLGIRALLSGVEKFAEKVSVKEALLDENGLPDASGAVVEVTKKVYHFSAYQGVPPSLQNKLASEPLLPEAIARLFYGSLGYILIALGLMLLLGLWTRVSLFAMGVLYIMLSVGLILLGQDAGVGSLGIHVALVAFALVLASHNRYTITRS